MKISLKIKGRMLDNLEANSFSPSLKGYGGPIRALIGGQIHTLVRSPVTPRAK